MRTPPALTWTFPLPRPHTGVPLSNGTQGLLVWGEGNTLHLTISRLGFWDRRGGNAFLSKTTFPEVRALLEARDEEGLLRVFGKNTSHASPARPHQLGGGRLELRFPSAWRLHEAVLHPGRGEIAVKLISDAGTKDLRIRMAVATETAELELPEGVEPESIRVRPSWEWIGEELREVGCVPPEVWSDEGEWGFVQTLPEDEPLAVAVRRRDTVLRIGTHVGPDAGPKARAASEADLAGREAWWADYWQSVPEVELPDPVLQEIVEYGLYLQAICTPPQGLACTLQGALMEETRIPPWSNDYHFNINAQMIYTPALATNRLAHLDPLWDLLRSWLPQLQGSGASFFGDADALMLPHAVDDKCQVVGAFWTGSIDHACTAWVGLLCWDAVRFGGDLTLLRELAWPLLRGAFAGYRAMAEDDGKGGLRLPVSVSPEYKGSRMDAWGRNASFQLAAAHGVLRALPQAAALLGEADDPAWLEMRERLPPYCSARLPDNAEAPENLSERIVLWEGQDLDGSHRHHSHLAGLTPFKTLDPRDPERQSLLRNSLRAWQYKGPGAWSGWCVPWAASLHAHNGEADAAVFWLHYWRKLFTNEGRASLHDAAFPGVSNLDGSSAYHDALAEVMQLDGRFGALTAVLDILVQEFDGEIRILPRLPRDWKTLRFRGILAPGGFLVSAEVDGGALRRLDITATRAGTLRLLLPDGTRVTRDMQAGDVESF